MPSLRSTRRFAARSLAVTVSGVAALAAFGAATPAYADQALVRVNTGTTGECFSVTGGTVGLAPPPKYFYVQQIVVYVNTDPATSCTL